MRIRRKQFIWVFYYITYTILLFDTTDNVPGTHIFRLMKYVFILFMLLENFKTIGIERKFLNKATVFIGLIFVHTVLFGCFFVNEIVKEETFNHFRQMMVFLFMVYLVARYCYWTKTKKEFLTATFFSYVTFLGWCYLTHINGFAPLRYLLKLPKILMDDDRYGFTFGMSNRSITGNYACMAIIIMVMLWQYQDEFKGILRKYKKQILICGCFGFGAILISAASRGEIVSAAIFIILMGFIRRKQHLGNKRIQRVINFLLVILGIFVIMSIITMTFAEGSASNRTNNLWINYNVFREYGNWNTGMGYIEQHGFYNDAYGFDTWPCDVYYLYIFFSTGIVGSIIMGMSLLWLGLNFFFWGKVDYRTEGPMKALFLTMLFNNLFHCTFNSYYYLSSIPMMILFIEHLYCIEEHSRTIRV